MWLKALEQLDPQDRGVVLAKNSILCSECNNEQIGMLLVRIYNLLGLPSDKWPTTDEEIGALNYDIKVHLPGVRIKEIEQAFIAAINGLLTTPNGKPFDLNSYGLKFSFRYLGECVNAFKIYSQKVVKEHTAKMRRLENVDEVKPPMTSEQKKQNRKQFYEELISFIEKNKCLPAAWAYDKAFIHAWNNEIIKDNPDEIEMFRQNVISELREEAEIERVKGGTGAFKELVARNSQPQTIQYQCRKRRLIAFLKKQYDFI